jgi:cobalt-zinc-cadmium efflux system protein
MSHAHNHGPSNYNRAFAIGVILNLSFVALEVGYGVIAGSLALIADAGHNLSDVLSLLLAWGASVLAAKSASETRTYGYRKATIMAALASAILLLVALGGIAWEAIGRIRTPQAVTGTIVIVVAAIGVVINTITALLFVSGKDHDLNIKGAFLHMLADAGVSLGVVVAGILILYRGWLWIDPVISLIIAGVILLGTWGLLRQSINQIMDAVPEGVDMVALRSYLTSLENVTDFHDLHVWHLSTTEIALTVHLVVTEKALNNDFLRDLQQRLHDEFGIEHATIQVEQQEMTTTCLLDRHKCI